MIPDCSYFNAAFTSACWGRVADSPEHLSGTVFAERGSVRYQYQGKKGYMNTGKQLQGAVFLGFKRRALTVNVLYITW